MSANGGTVTVEVNGKDVNLSEMLARLEADVARFEKTSTESGRKAGAGAQQARSGFLALQQAVASNEAATAKAAAAAGDYTQAASGYSAAIQRLENILQAQNQTTTQTLAVERQLITLRQQAAKAAQAEADAVAKASSSTQGMGAQLASSRTNLESFVGSLTSLNSALGTFGVALGAKQLVDFGADALQSSLDLKQTENALRQIAGSQDTYNRILAAAKEQQRNFGGSLADNLKELSTFAVQARTTGADLDELIRTAQRLAALDPEQGVSGAKIALNEALSGDPKSLAARFEIPRKELEKLRDSSTTAAEKLQIVNQYLDSAGIAANGYASAVEPATRAINEMNASLETLKLNAGAALSQAFLPGVQGVTQLAEAINGTAPAINGFVGAQQAANSVVQATGGFFGSVLGPINAYNNLVVGGIGGLFGYTAAEETAAQGTAQHAQATAQAITMTDGYVQSLTQNTSAAEAVTAAMLGVDAAMLKDISDKQQATQQTNTLNAVQATLASLGGAVQAGLLTAGQGAAVLASQYGIATQEGIKLLNIQAQLAHQQFQLKEAQVVAGAAVARTGTGLGDEVQRDRQSQRAAQVAQVNQNYAASEAARRRQIEATGSAAQKAALAQSDYNAAVKKYGADSAQAIDAETKILELKDKTTKAGKKTGAAKLSDQAKLNNTLASNEQQYQNQAEEEQIKHGQNLIDIEQKYQDKISDIQLKALQKRKDQADKNEVDKRQNELGFLESATSSSLNGSKGGQAELQRIQQNYYASFQKSQEAAQNGEVEKSQRILKDAEDRANVELKYAEKIADLKDKLGEAHNKKEKQAIQDQINLQETLRKKALDIEDVKTGQTGASADAINAGEQTDLQKAAADRQQALTDETKRNTEALDKLTRSLDNKNDLATDSAVRAGKKVNPDGSDSTPLTTPPAPSAAPSTATPVPVAPVANTNSGPLPVDAPDLGAKLDAIAAQIAAMKDAMVKAEGDGATKVETAIKTIKLTAPRMQ